MTLDDISLARSQQLAQLLPSLRKAFCVSPWDANTLDQWAASGGPSHGERVAAKFILAVWNPDENWLSGKFDVMEALRVFDAQHHQVFLAWAANPWWA